MGRFIESKLIQLLFKSNLPLPAGGLSPADLDRAAAGEADVFPQLVALYNRAGGARLRATAGERLPLG